MSYRRICLVAAVIALANAPLGVQAGQIAPNPNPVLNTLWVNTSGAFNAVPFKNNGEVFVEYSFNLDNSNTMDNYGTLYNSGTLNNNSGGTINVNQNSFMYNYGTLYNNSGGNLNIYYSMENPGLVYNNSGGTLTIDNYGGLSTTNLVVNNGILNMQNQGLLNVKSGWLQNLDTLNLKYDGNLENHGTLSNEFSGLVNVNNGSTLTNYGTLGTNGTVNNNGSLYNTGGTINVGSSGQIISLSGGGFYHQTMDGSKTVVNGSLTQNSFYIDNGTLGGNGSVTVKNLYFFGDAHIGAGATIAPGDPIGKLTINGNLISSGKLLFNIAGLGAGGQYSVLQINGNATFSGGNIEFDFVNGFSPSPGNSWDFLSAGSIIGWDTLGVFFNASFDGLGYEIETLTNGERLLITTGTGLPVPLPPSAFLLGSGLLGLVGWRRFRKG